MGSRGSRPRREKPDIIPMDMSLPVMDGWEATRCVKSDDATRGVPVIDRLIGKIERLLRLGKG
jgi:CheY-like chemotaxis protein